VAYFVIGMASYGVMSTMALFAVDFGYPGLQGAVVSVSLIASAALLVPLGAVCDRFGSRWALTICCAAAIVASLLLCVGSLPAAAVFIASACSGAAYNSTIVPVSVSVREAFGARDYSKKLGFCAGCATVGISAGPTVTSMFFDLTGSYHIALIAFAVLCALSAAVFHIVARPRAC
ncbi:MAG: MFS transporter, partial [Coriobacteriaceae bacterium]|nr:MFS transporter [Coriobacteriaceae bacterium]